MSSPSPTESGDMVIAVIVIALFSVLGYSLIDGSESDAMYRLDEIERELDNDDAQLRMDELRESYRVNGNDADLEELQYMEEDYDTRSGQDYRDGSQYQERNFEQQYVPNGQPEDIDGYDNPYGVWRERDQ